MSVWVVVVAAGQGARFGGPTPKQFLPLAGRPLLAHTLGRFVAHGRIDGVVVVLPRDGFETHAAAVRSWELGGRALRLVPGGAERQDSTREGLAAVPAEATLVLVHDGARPLVPAGLVDAVVDETLRCGAAVPAVPVVETLKTVDEAGRVRGTVDRDRLVRAQTPQGFRRALLERALAEAARRGLRGTDEAALVERLGAEVRIVAGAEANLKVTTPEDLALAEYYLAREAARGR